MLLNFIEIEYIVGYFREIARKAIKCMLRFRLLSGGACFRDVLSEILLYKLDRPYIKQYLTIEDRKTISKDVSDLFIFLATAQKSSLPMFVDEACLNNL